MSSDRLQDSLDIDRRSAIEIVDLIQSQDRLVVDAIAVDRERLARAIEEVAERLRHGGRMFYIGAGTSGRIAMVDASELPPTFGVPADLVQVIMAGGEEAFFRAVEGAEDSEEEGIAAVAARVRAEDAVVGIAASGSTPFTVGGIRKANMLGALTIGITSVANSPLVQECDIPIVAATGPEVIMGSSRMKSGTAQKLILNTLSTGVMVLLGKVYSNLMIEMPATNQKLQRRAQRMVEIASGASAAEARRALVESGGDVKGSIVMLKRGVTAEEARALLEGSHGNLRGVLES